MAYDNKSQDTINFAKKIINRCLGNQDDQRIIYRDPNRNLEYGIIFSQQEANKSRRGNRTDVRPNAMSTRFIVEDTGQSLELSIIPSFWLYFRHKGDKYPPEDIGDRWDLETIWTDWSDRPVPLGSQPDGKKIPEGSPRIYIRTRYCKAYSVSIGTGQNKKSIELDLPDYKKTRSPIGDSPAWNGAIHVTKKQLGDKKIEVSVTLVNQYRARFRESAWFDVRMKVKHNRKQFTTYCPILNTNVSAQSVNCIVADESTAGEIILEQINCVLQHRKNMITAISFADADWEMVAEAIEDFAAAASDRHRQQLLEAVKTISANQTAVLAMNMVLEAYRRAMRVRIPDGSAKWYRHQLSILVLGAVKYLTGKTTLNPLIINVPTAGGKTEAFSALAFWTVAYEVLQNTPTWATAIIKYPTKLLSSDQAERLSHYVMHFDNILVETTGRSEERRGLGLFFGADSEDLDVLEVIGRECPECGQPWSVKNKTAKCNNDHQVIIALKDDIFPRPPTIIIGTIDKFVSKSQRREMATILGGSNIYFCPKYKRYLGKDYCWDTNNRKKEDHDHQLVSRKSRLTAIILDEAHMLREEVGSLDSHFETYYLEIANELSGRYPLAVVSTATIAQAEEHCRQLGLGTPTMFPGNEQENDLVYYKTDKNRIQHVVVSCMPRGRSISWALPHLFGHYLHLYEVEEISTPGRLRQLKPMVVYCNSYMNRNLTRESIKRYIEPEFREKYNRNISVGEFSRERFNKVGMRYEVEYIDDKDVILSTNIASVGVDLGALNAITYFGFPYNVNEFIQSMNRTGRRDPAIAIIIHNPYLERDAAFYSYLNIFMKYPEKLVEAVPLNRFARLAIEHTFSSVALGLLYHVWSDPKRTENADLSRARKYFSVRGFQNVYGKDLNAEEVIELLLRSYRANNDPSNVYPDDIKKRWNTMASNILNYRPQNRRSDMYKFGDNWVRHADGVRDPMYQLRIPSPEGDVVLNPRAEKLARENIKAIYSNEKDADDNIVEEEISINDGALKDSLQDEGGEE